MNIYYVAGLDALQALKSDHLAVSLIGLGSKHGLSVADCYLRLGGLISGGYARIPTLHESDVGSVIEVLSAWRQSLEGLASWTEELVAIAISTRCDRDVIAATSAMLGCIGQPKAGLRVDEILVVIGKKNALGWIDQVIKILRSAAMVG